jgi:hypothetical protein
MAEEGEKSAEKNSKPFAEQLKSEIKLLNHLDPDKELKKDFEVASLQDLQKYLDE